MAKLSIQKKQVPFLFRGIGELSIDTGNLEISRPLDETSPVVLKAGFNAGSDPKIALGQDNTVKIAVSTAASVQLVPVFSSTKGPAVDLLNANGIGRFFENGANPDKVVLGFDIGGSTDIGAAGSFAYSALKAGVDVDTGVNAAYTYLRALDKTLPVERLLQGFFQTMRLPEQADGAPQPGEAISLRYGGYLRIAAEASAGYKLAGTKSVSLGELALSEKYDLSILGRIGLNAAIAGQFSIIVTGVGELPGWARVRVKRHSAKSFGIAADVNVAFKSQLDNLPATANEFLGAALGVNAKNFLTIFQKATDLTGFEEFKAAIDGLAQKYIAEYIGKGFDRLATVPEFTSFLGRVNQVVASYDQVGDRAVALFDRYFDQITDLTAFLEKIRALKPEGLDTLRKDLNPQFWNMLSQLTDGDPLGFLLKQVTMGGKNIDTVSELQARAGSVLDLIRGASHDEIRKVITLAKQSFGIDKFFTELARIDTVDELAALANEKTGLFVTRLVGRTLDSSANLKQAFKEVQAVTEKIDVFKDKLYGAFKEVLRGSYKLALHAEYTRASEDDALIDVLINLGEQKGKDLLAEAGKGDFEETLTTSDTNLVRLREGVFTHRTRRESAFKVNIIGWHLNYKYEGFDRVIVDTEQRLVPSDRGITVLTTASLEVERLRKRQNEQTHVNFLLRALGESSKAIKSDGRTTAYLIDTLKSLTARYELSFTDADTSAAELQDYLAFARDLGLDKRGATLETLDPLLPRAANKGFGAVEASYDVRFGEKAVSALLSIKKLSPRSEQSIRNAMRQMVLCNYLKSDEMHDVAFAYATEGVFKEFESEGFAQFGNHSQRVFRVQLSGPLISAPATVVLDKMELNVLITLYNIENSMVKAVKELCDVLNSGTAIDPVSFEKKLGKFGDALQNFDKFDQTSNKGGVGTNTIFSMFDMLVRIASPGGDASASLLRLKSQANGKQIEKVFFSDE